MVDYTLRFKHKNRHHNKFNKINKIHKDIHRNEELIVENEELHAAQDEDDNCDFDELLEEVREVDWDKVPHFEIGPPRKHHGKFNRVKE